MKGDRKSLGERIWGKGLKKKEKNMGEEELGIGRYMGKWVRDERILGKGEESERTIRE